MHNTLKMSIFVMDERDIPLLLLIFRFPLPVLKASRMIKKLFTSSGEKVSFFVSSNDSYKFLEATSNIAACRIKDILDRQAVYCTVSFSQKLGWFVRVPNFLFDKIRFTD